VYTTHIIPILVLEINVMYKETLIRLKVNVDTTELLLPYTNKYKRIVIREIV